MFFLNTDLCDEYSINKKCIPSLKSYKYRTDKVVVLTDQLHCLIDKYSNIVINPTIIFEMASLLSKHIKGSSSKCYTGFLFNYLNNKLSSTDLMFICCQIASNYKDLKNNLEIRMPVLLHELTWFPVVCKEIVTSVNTSDIILKCFILDGLFAGVYAFIKLSFNRLYGQSGSLFSKEFGFSFKNHRPFNNVRQLVNLIFFGLFTNDSINLHGYMKYTIKCLAIKTTVKQRQINTLLITSRNDICPVGFTHACHDCFIGYDKCNRGCKPISNLIIDSPPTEFKKFEDYYEKLYPRPVIHTDAI